MNRVRLLLFILFFVYGEIAVGGMPTSTFLPPPRTFGVSASYAYSYRLVPKRYDFYGNSQIDPVLRLGMHLRLNKGIVTYLLNAAYLHYTETESFVAHSNSVGAGGGNFETYNYKIDYSQIELRLSAQRRRRNYWRIQVFPGLSARVHLNEKHVKEENYSFFSSAESYRALYDDYHLLGVAGHLSVYRSWWITRQYMVTLGLTWNQDISPLLKGEFAPPQRNGSIGLELIFSRRW